MSRLTRSTLRMLVVRAGIANQEVAVEAQKLLELYEDPTVGPEQKAVVKAALDDKIKEIEERVTTRRLKEQRFAGPEPLVP